MSEQLDRQKGFTLIEILMVVGIIGLLGLVAVVGYQEYVSRARASDIVLKYDAIRQDVGIALTNDSSVDCAEQARRFSSANLGDEYAHLAYGFQATQGGYRPVLTVCARVDQGTLGVKVARGAHDTLARTGSVENGALVSDSVVSFALPLTTANKATCTAYQPTQNANCTSAQASLAQAPAQTRAQPPAQAVAALVPFNPQTATLPAEVKPVATDATSCAAGQEFAVVTGGGSTQRACAPVCRASERRTPTGACIVDVPPPQPSWAATPAFAISTPIPASGGTGPSCAAGQQLVGTFVGGKLQQTCARACPADQALGADGTCAPAPRAPDYQEPMCPGPCADTFLGDCNVDFNGMCDMDFVQEYCKNTCGLCGASSQIPCSSIAMRDGSTAQAPRVPGTGYGMTGVLPRRIGESVYLDSEQLVKVLNIQNPAGTTAPIQVTKLEISPHQWIAGGPAASMLPEFEAVQQADGRWRITRTRGITFPVSNPFILTRGNIDSNFFEVHITFDNGLGTNKATSSWGMTNAN